MSWQVTPSFTWNETVWNPSMLDTAVWLDGADASTITQSSGAVSQWADKSGKGRNAVQAESTNQPTFSATAINGKSAVSFDGTNDFLSLTWPSAVYPNYSTAFVFQWNGGGGGADGRRALYESIAPGNNVFRPSLALLGGASPVALRAFHGDGSSFGTATTSANYGTTPRLASTIGGGGVVSLFPDGSISGITSDTGSETFQTTGLRIGTYRSADNRWFSGFIAEIVVTHFQVSTANRQRLEGYLAHKWGLTASLPNDHPYKLIGPTP